MRFQEVKLPEKRKLAFIMLEVLFLSNPTNVPYDVKGRFCKHIDCIEMTRFSAKNKFTPL